MSDWTATIDALIDYLSYQQECGVRMIPLDIAALRALDAPLPRPTATATPATHSTTDSSPVTTTTGDTSSRHDRLAKIAIQAASCELCPLWQGRTCSVPGQGNPNSPDIMFVGDSPAAADNQSGNAFVDKDGDLLNKMIKAMGYTRDDIFLTNVCKCYGPNGRRPKLNEMRACLPYLISQIDIINPKVIIALGADAAMGLTNAQNSTGLAKLRGQWTRLGSTPLIFTYHPKNKLMALPPAKREAWHDLKKVLALLRRPLPPRT